MYSPGALKVAVVVALPLKGGSRGRCFHFDLVYKWRIVGEFHCPAPSSGRRSTRACTSCLSVGSFLLGNGFISSSAVQAVKESGTPTLAVIGTRLALRTIHKRTTFGKRK